MPRTFAYVRVSTLGQTTDNQTQEIQAAGRLLQPYGCPMPHWGHGGDIR